MTFDDGRLLINMLLMEACSAAGIPLTQFRWGPQDLDVGAFPLVVFMGASGFLLHFNEREITHADTRRAPIRRKLRRLVVRMGRKLRLRRSSRGEFVL